MLVDVVLAALLTGLTLSPWPGGRTAGSAGSPAR
jgi:hypothetical protein